MSTLPPLHIRKLIEADIANAPGQLLQITDYLLVWTDNHGGRTPAGWAGPVDVASDVRIEQLDAALAERLDGASQLRGENWEQPPGGHVVHAYVRDVWAKGGSDPGNIYSWDSDVRVYACLVLSRLVRDNATSCEGAVRRLVRQDGQEKLIPIRGFDSHVAYCLRPDEPGWLDVDEAKQLRVLMDAYDTPGLPERVRRAIPRVESVAGERFLEDALPLAVGGVEALLKVGRAFAKQQFVQRGPAVAAELGTSLTDAQAAELYDDRSALVHGASVDLKKPHKRTSFEDGFIALQDTLRAAVQRALEDPAFAAVFAQDGNLTARWPVTVQKGSTTVTL
jgi:hypothetical protein